MNTLLEEHPLPPDTWDAPPLSPLVLQPDDSSPTSLKPTTVPPPAP